MGISGNIYCTEELYSEILCEHFLELASCMCNSDQLPLPCAEFYSMLKSRARGGNLLRKLINTKPTEHHESHAPRRLEEEVNGETLICAGRHQGGILEVHGPEVKRLIDRYHDDPRGYGARLEAKALATEVTRRPAADSQQPTYVSFIERLR